MSKSFKLEEAIWLDINDDGYPHHFCPDCLEHLPKKLEPTKYYDCKNVFTVGTGKFNEYGEIRECCGQCMCYAPEHGIREKRKYF